jgi:preprotein translocase subunit SecF
MLSHSLRLESTMIDFLKYRFVYAVFSILIFIGFIGLYSYRMATRGYAFTYSVDFTGGTQVLLRFSKPTADSQIKEVLERNGWSNPVMRDFSSTEVAVRLKQVSTDTKGFSENIQKSLQDAMPDNKVEILSVDSVSGGIGEVLRWKSIYAVALALFLMLLYIWFRFWSVSFGVGAVVALFHDAMVILFAFLLLDKEISINVISAILAVLGYSINDTIVIFTKIRQNIKTMKNVSIDKIVNISLNQTLRRTILTSFATTLVVLSLMILGGEALRDLSLALLIGMIFGTYSSIYIASPIMLLLYKEGAK